MTDNQTLVLGDWFMAETDGNVKGDDANCLQGENPIYDFDVDWGDGTIEHYTLTNQTERANCKHRYTKGGKYTMRIVGRCDYLTRRDDYSSTSMALRGVLTNIRVENTSPIKHVRACFIQCRKLISVGDGLFDNAQNHKEFFTTFSNCTNLLEVPLTLFDYNVNLTQFSNGYAIAGLLTSAPINLWSNPNIFGSGTTRDCFAGCSSLTCVYYKNVRDEAALTKYIPALPNRSRRAAGKLYLMATPGYEDKALLTPTQEHIDAAAALNWVFADPAELSQE